MHLDRRHDDLTSTLTAALLLCLAGTARCQTSADLTLVSEYAARGVALDTRPALQLRVEHETDGGWYGGAFASPVKLYGRAQGELVAYAGRAQRLTPTLSWDAGVTHTSFQRADDAYTEWYAGVALERASARLFYSPAYYGGGRTLYLDTSATEPLGDRLRLAAHAGLLHPFGGDERRMRDGADVRLALVATAGDWSLQAGVQVQWHAYLAGTARAHALTAGASLHF